MSKMISKEEIQKISKKINMSEEEVKKKMRETLNSISKPDATDDDEVGNESYINFNNFLCLSKKEI